MIVVNTSGSDEYVYGPLEHAAWNGITPTDFVFPFFVFIVGVSIVLAFSNQLAKGKQIKDMVPKLIRRSITIFLLGVFLNLFPEFDFGSVRIAGVLQRIAIVFLACSLLYLYTSEKTQWKVGIGLLVVYYLIMVLVPHPAYGEVLLEPGKNIAAWIDSILMPGSMYQGTWDPEGILSTLPAIGTGVTGLLIGHLLKSDRSQQDKVIWMMLGGFIAFTLGSIWNWFFPINKNLWTSSYVLYTSGLAAMTLGASYYIIDMLGKRQFTFFGIVFGSNAITAYVLSGVLPVLTHTSIFGGESMRSLFMSGLTGIGLDVYFVSLLWALMFCFLCYIPIYYLYKNKIFIKI
ncbi:lpg1661 family Dot/Icm T4SS effector [Membranihabitans marinus]